MFERYLRLEQKIFKQDARSIAHLLIVLELAGAPLVLLFGSLGDDLVRAIGMVAGAGVVSFGLRLPHHSHPWNKIAIAVGGFPVTFLFHSIYSPLGVLVSVIYFIVTIISFVA